jgi:hypothetical protein
MKPIVLVVAVAAYFAAAALTFAVIRWLDSDDVDLSLGVGAIAGAQFSAIMHGRIRGLTSTRSTKAMVGAALSLSAVVFGHALHQWLGAFEDLGVSIPLAAIGSFIFPFILFDHMRALVAGKSS